MSTVTNNTSDHLYIISNFSALDPDRVATPLVLANCALAAESDAVIWLTMDGVELARQGAANDFAGEEFCARVRIARKFHREWRTDRCLSTLRKIA